MVFVVGYGSVSVMEVSVVEPVTTAEELAEGGEVLGLQESKCQSAGKVSRAFEESR